MLKKRFVCFVFLSILIALSFYSKYDSNNALNQTYLKTSQSSPISINGNYDWVNFRDAGGCTGVGTSANPYIIRDISINGASTNICIEIHNSDVHFIIENCTIFNCDEGIQFFNVKNGIIRNSYLFDHSWAAISLFSSSSNTIDDNQLNSNPEYGIYISGDDSLPSDNNIIKDNTVSGSNYGINLEGTDNIQITGNTLESNAHGVNIWLMTNSHITGNVFKFNNIGINIGDECSCLTISDNQFITNVANIVGEQEECPILPIPLPLIIGITIGVLGILIISIFIVRKKRRTRKEELIEINEKPITLKSNIDIKADIVEPAGEIIEPIPLIDTKEVEITSEDIKPIPPLPPEEISKIEELAYETLKEDSTLKEESEISPETIKVEEIEIQDKVGNDIPPLVPNIENLEEDLLPEVHEIVEEEDLTESMESFCPNCGRQIKTTWKFCPDCKMEIIEEIPQETEEKAPEEEIIDEVKEFVDENAITEEETEEIIVEDQELGKEPIKEPIVEENTEEHIVEEEELAEKMVTEPVGPVEQVCSNCGKQIKDTWRICPYCRFRLKEEELKPVIEELSPIPEEEVSQLVEPEKIEDEVPPDEIKPEVKEFEPTEVVELPEYKVEGSSIPKPSSTHKIVEDESWRERIKRAAPEDFEKIEVKFCTNCGKQLQPTWNICPYCRFRIKKEELEVVAPKKEVTAEFTVREFPKEPSRLITQEEYEVERKQKLPQETIKPSVSIPPKTIEEPKVLPKPKVIVKEFPKEPSKIIPPKPIEEIKPKPPPEPPKPKENICPFCGLKNELEKVTCIRCGYKLKK